MAWQSKGNSNNQSCGQKYVWVRAVVRNWLRSKLWMGSGQVNDHFSVLGQNWVDK